MTGRGRLMALCISRRLFGVIGLDIGGARAVIRVSEEPTLLGVANIAGAVAVR